MIIATAIGSVLLSLWADAQSKGVPFWAPPQDTVPPKLDRTLRLILSQTQHTLNRCDTAHGACFKASVDAYLLAIGVRGNAYEPISNCGIVLIPTGRHQVEMFRIGWPWPGDTEPRVFHFVLVIDGQVVDMTANQFSDSDEFPVPYVPDASLGGWVEALHEAIYRGKYDEPIIEPVTVKAELWSEECLWGGIGPWDTEEGWGIGSTPEERISSYEEEFELRIEEHPAGHVDGKPFAGARLIESEWRILPSEVRADGGFIHDVMQVTTWV